MESKVLVYLNANTVEKLLEMTTERIFQLEYSAESMQEVISDLREKLKEAKENQKEEEE
ncbi:MAG: hypothetical protein II477_10310 [Lachnospiraceae bacterium]|nr:hypothetical protein [Lachnospiraceae bacterium]